MTRNIMVNENHFYGTFDMDLDTHKNILDFFKKQLDGEWESLYYGIVWLVGWIILIHRNMYFS